MIFFFYNHSCSDESLIPLGQMSLKPIELSIRVSNKFVYFFYELEILNFFFTNKFNKFNFYVFLTSSTY